MRAQDILPAWVNYGVIPFINLLLAFLVSGLIILLIGENPFEALGVMLEGAFILPGAFGYSLYYSTNFIFTGLAVALAFHANLFNIGGEGQAALGGLGIASSLIYLHPFLPIFILIPFALLASFAFGAFWGFIPGILQAKRGSHVVITTIMFNFIAASIMVWLLAGILQNPKQSNPESPPFIEASHLAKLQDIVALLGIDIAPSPANISLFIALLAAIWFWFFIWRTKTGYAIRTCGYSPKASIYAGHQPTHIIILTMSISGGLAGMMAINELMGVQHKLALDFTAGYGFTGIAVALMGRNHPIGIILASLLFGALYQGGTELDFVYQTISREFVQIISGLIILFSGALAFMLNPMMEKLYLRMHKAHEVI